MFTIIDTLVQPLLTAFQTLGLDEAEVQRGVEAIKLGAMQLALELAQAETIGVPMADAVRDADNYPHLVQAHNSILDVLTLELPKEFTPFLQCVAAMPNPPPLDEMTRDLARVGATAQGPQRALARFILFEGVRLQLLVTMWRQTPDLHRLGIDDYSWDRQASDNLDVLLAHPQDLEGPDPIRPLEVVLTATLTDLLKYVGEAERALGQIEADVRARYARRAMVEEALLDANARDAVLIRNCLARAWGAQRLDIGRVMKQHPLPFDGTKRNAIDQHVSRRQLAMIEDGLAVIPVRRKPALIDLILTRFAEVSQ